MKLYEIKEQIREEVCSAKIYADRYREIKCFQIGKVYRKMAKDEIRHARSLMAIGRKLYKPELMDDLFNIEETLHETELMIKSK